MGSILKVNNLNYMDFSNINLSFDSNKIYFIVGGNKSGKTTLFRILSSLIPTNNIICFNNEFLNRNNRNNYIKKIGVINRVNKYSFIYKSVKSELLSPLLNLGYSYSEAKKRIYDVLSIFNMKYIYSKKVNELNCFERQTLLIIISLLHKPKVLLLDNVFDIYKKSKRENILNILKKYMLKENITIINFTSSLEDIMISDKVIILSKFKIVKETTFMEIYNNDKLFYENNLEIPFIFDIVNKLKMYDLVKNNYTDMKDLVDDIWH